MGSNQDRFAGDFWIPAGTKECGERDGYVGGVVRRLVQQNWDTESRGRRIVSGTRVGPSGILLWIVIGCWADFGFHLVIGTFRRL